MCDVINSLDVIYLNKSFFYTKHCVVLGSLRILIRVLYQIAFLADFKSWLMIWFFNLREDFGKFI